MTKHMEGLGNECSWEGAVKGGFKQTAHWGLFKISWS